MNNKKTTLVPETMKAIARYEITFTDAVHLPDEYDDIGDYVDIPEEYRYTLDDLYTALKNITDKNPPFNDFVENWYYPLWQLEQEFGITEACSDSDLCYDEQPDPGLVRGLPLTWNDVFSDVWCSFENVWPEWEDAKYISDIPDFSRYLIDIERYYAEYDLPLSERTFSREQKENYIEPFKHESRLKGATEPELELCRQFTEELCEKDSKTALHLKGYACYGGDRLYPCDWPVSRDCIKRLYELTDNPQYANTLGYIYYYGRCTDGVPEYEKAFEMFAVSAANGLYEGMYKLGDMFRHGYACKKSPGTAEKLYSLVYDDALSGFAEGMDNSFADAALRMGNVCLKGIGMEPDIRYAYYYFLQADFANRRRLEHSDFFGNTTVAIGIRRSLDETKAMLGDDFFRDYIETEEPWILYELLKGKNRVSISVNMTENGDAVVHAERVPLHAGTKAEPLLVTEPELDWCELRNDIEFTALNAEVFFMTRNDGPVKIDYAEWNYIDQCVELYFNDESVGRIKCDGYRLYAPPKPAPSGRLLHLVSVRFQPDGRGYDYLCEDDMVKEGDTVIVPGYSGETPAVVIRVYSKYESELGLPPERYKKVIGRA